MNYRLVKCFSSSPDLVFLAEWEERKVVLKMITKTKHPSAESAAMCKLQGLVNVPELLACHEEEINFYERPVCEVMVQEYIEGHALDEIKELNFSLEKRREIIQKLREEVCKMHEANVAHCDIKEDNIIYDEKEKVYLIDFGLAQIGGELIEELKQKDLLAIDRIEKNLCFLYNLEESQKRGESGHYCHKEC